MLPTSEVVFFFDIFERLHFVKLNAIKTNGPDGKVFEGSPALTTSSMILAILHFLLILHFVLSSGKEVRETNFSSQQKCKSGLIEILWAANC